MRIIIECEGDLTSLEKVLNPLTQINLLKIICIRTTQNPKTKSIVQDWADSCKLLNTYVKERGL